MIITCANAKCQRGREVRLQREWSAGAENLNDTLQIQSIDSVLSPYQYGNYEYIDYDITYEDTVNFYNPPLQVGK